MGMPPSVVDNIIGIAGLIRIYLPPLKTTQQLARDVLDP